jgi:cytochrome b6-f complex iron-sulfur subunit
MSSAAIIGIVVAVLVVAAIVLVAVTARRSDARSATGYLSRETRQRDKAAAPVVSAPRPATGKEVELAAEQARKGTDLEPAAPTAPAPYVPMEPEQIGFTRRQFLNRANGAMMGVGLGAFGGAVLAFLWPKLSGGFGSKITIGKVEDVTNGIRDGKGFYYVPEGRAWITAYPAEAVPKAQKVYTPPVVAGMQSGFVALYQKCVHLGCRVPECVTSQWFECPCHGSQYNRAGEKKGGPAPRGLDRFGLTVANGSVSIDTGTIFQGPPIGTNTTGQEAEGPHCVGGGE